MNSPFRRPATLLILVAACAAPSASTPDDAASPHAPDASPPDALDPPDASDPEAGGSSEPGTLVVRATVTYCSGGVCCVDGTCYVVPSGAPFCPAPPPPSACAPILHAARVGELSFP